MIFDYETLKLIWWLFVGVLLVGFAVTDGFDLGIGALLPFLGKNDDERRGIARAARARGPAGRRRAEVTPCCLPGHCPARPARRRPAWMPAG